MGKGGEAPRTAKNSNSPRVYKWEEIQEHNNPTESAWIVFENKVYDITNYGEHHPGGAVIFTHAGDDATDIFHAFHERNSHKYMKPYYIGELDVSSRNLPTKQTDFETGYRELRKQLIELGLFKSNPWYYVYKCASNHLLLFTAIGMVYYSDNVLVHMLSACLLGLFFQQCGWLAHDFLHHQVFQSTRRYGDYGGIYWGNLMQGYSVCWWKNKHNGHHAVPNLHNSTPTSQDGDPDIDTMPVLAWSVQQAQSFLDYQKNNNKGGGNSFMKFMIRNQSVFYFPILLLARLSWMNESFKTAFGLGASTENAKLELQKRGLQYPILEKLGIILHYCWMFVVSSGFGRFTFAYSVGYFLLATCSCGFVLALVFGLGHNGMSVYDADKRPDFWKLQVTTTRNIIGGHGFSQGFVDWFCGGLQYQVDHHLFPTLPRHSLKKAHDLVESFCKEWNVHYHEADLIDGTVEVLKHLSDVSNEFVMEFVKDGPAM